jgi:hypothetical protein
MSQKAFQWFFHQSNLDYSSIILEALKKFQGLTPFASHFMNFPVHLVHLVHEKWNEMLTVPRLDKKHTTGKLFERAFI